MSILRRNGAGRLQLGVIRRVDGNLVRGIADENVVPLPGIGGDRQPHRHKIVAFEIPRNELLGGQGYPFADVEEAVIRLGRVVALGQRNEPARTVQNSIRVHRTRSRPRGGSGRRIHHLHTAELVGPVGQNARQVAPEDNRHEFEVVVDIVGGRGLVIIFQSVVPTFLALVLPAPSSDVVCGIFRQAEPDRVAVSRPQWSGLQIGLADCTVPPRRLEPNHITATVVPGPVGHPRCGDCQVGDDVNKETTGARPQRTSRRGRDLVQGRGSRREKGDNKLQARLLDVEQGAVVGNLPELLADLEGAVFPDGGNASPPDLDVNRVAIDILPRHVSQKECRTGVPAHRLDGRRPRHAVEEFECRSVRQRRGRDLQIQLSPGRMGCEQKQSGCHQSGEPWKKPAAIGDAGHGLARGKLKRFIPLLFGNATVSLTMAQHFGTRRKDFCLVPSYARLRCERGRRPVPGITMMAASACRWLSLAVGEARLSGAGTVAAPHPSARARARREAPHQDRSRAE